MLQGSSLMEINGHSIQFYFSSIIEHTNQMIYLEDDDVAAVKNGSLTIHRVKRNDPNEATEREVMEVKMEIQEIMKGIFFFLYLLYMDNCYNGCCLKKLLWKDDQIKITKNVFLSRKLCYIHAERDL